MKYKDIEDFASENYLKEETVRSFLFMLRQVVTDEVKKALSEKNIEVYKDMIVTAASPVEDDDGNILYYLYDVKDTDTGDTYEGVLNKSNTPDAEIVADNLVRVYVSNIEYIGLKL